MKIFINTFLTTKLISKTKFNLTFELFKNIWRLRIRMADPQTRDEMYNYIHHTWLISNNILTNVKTC